MSHGPLPTCYQCGKRLDMRDPMNYGYCTDCTYVELSKEIEQQAAPDRQGNRRQRRAAAANARKKAGQ